MLWPFVAVNPWSSSHPLEFAFHVQHVQLQPPLSAEGGSVGSEQGKKARTRAGQSPSTAGKRYVAFFDNLGNRNYEIYYLKRTFF